MQPLKEQTTLNRGLKNVNIDSFKIGEIIPEKGFMSNSFDKEIASAYDKME